MRISKTNQSGFSLIEVVVVIVITGILLTVALRTGSQITDSARTEETLQELDHLAIAMVGDPGSYSNGTRTEFGYVGDVGSLPPNLDALVANPGGYSTWNGPYIDNRYVQTTTDFKKDAWQVDYMYSGGISISSTGSGETISREFAGSTDDLLYNAVIGNIYDLDGTPPGSTYNDSVSVRLTMPNGTGAFNTKYSITDAGGYFRFDSIPIGNHDLTIIYSPSNDTLKRFVIIPPNSEVYEEYRLPLTSWTSAGGGLEYVPGSIVITGAAPHCDAIEFEIVNNSSSAVAVSSISLSWTTPVAYYKKCHVDGSMVFNDQSPRNGSGDLVTFATTVINVGATLTISFEMFNDTVSGGGSKTNMQSTDFTVLLSDGSTFTFTTGTCP